MGGFPNIPGISTSTILGSGTYTTPTFNPNVATSGINLNSAASIGLNLAGQFLPPSAQKFFNYGTQALSTLGALGMNLGPLSGLFGGTAGTAGILSGIPGLSGIFGSSGLLAGTSLASLGSTITGAVVPVLASIPIIGWIGLGALGAFFGLKALFGNGVNKTIDSYEKMLKSGANPAQAYQALSGINPPLAGKKLRKAQKKMRKLIAKAQKDPTGRAAQVVKAMIQSFKDQGVPLPADLAAANKVFQGPVPPYAAPDASTAAGIFKALTKGGTIPLDKNRFAELANAAGVGQSNIIYDSVTKSSRTATPAEQVEIDKGKLVDVLGELNLPRDADTMNAIAATVVDGNPNAGMSEKFAAYMMNKTDGSVDGIKDGKVSIEEFSKTFGTGTNTAVGQIAQQLYSVITEYGIAKQAAFGEGKDANQAAIEGYKSLSPDEKEILATAYSLGNPDAAAIINEVRSAITSTGTTGMILPNLPPATTSYGSNLGPNFTTTYGIPTTIPSTLAR